MFDYVIIGGGIAGLYAYEKLEEHGHKNIILLEANNYVGGRMGIDMWYGAKLSIGAGIGRKSKDKLLQELCKKHGIIMHEFEVNKDVLGENTMHETELRETINILKNSYVETAHKELTFRQYGMEILGASKYQRFIKSYEYTDMEKADVYETLMYYGLDDGYNGWTGLSIPWDALIDKMIVGKRIKLNAPVIKLTQVASGFAVETDNHIYKSANVVLAVTIDSVRRLLGKNRIYRQVEGQPFMRIYGKFGREAANVMHNYVPRSCIIPNQCKRIIPMTDDVYMIVYSDNTNANYINERVTGNNKESREFLSGMLERGLGIDGKQLALTSIKQYYWPIGTHYMRPFMEGESYEKWIREAQHPAPHIWVVGEAFSRNQGWVEGALESVNAAFNKKN